MQVLIEVDVLMDVQTPTRALFAALFGTDYARADFCAKRALNSLSREDYARVWRILSAPGFAAALEPVAGAIDAVSQLREEGHAVRAVSKLLFGANWLQERAQWLQERAGFSRADISFSAQLSRVPGDLLISDDPSDIRLWKTRHSSAQAILWQSQRTRCIDEDPAWFHACDWQIVRWFSRRPFQLAATG